MTDKEKLVKECREIESTIFSLKMIMDLKKQSIAEINCSFVIDNKIIDERGRVAIVSDIQASYSYDNYEMDVFFVKKNGDKYKSTNRVFMGGDWRLLNDKAE